MYLYVDGARLACALMANENTIQASDLAKYVDAFYIGGTKNGLMMGEALVIVNDCLKEEFRYTQKHFGGLLAKGFYAVYNLRLYLKTIYFLKLVLIKII